jgi:hypothetical protein
MNDMANFSKNAALLGGALALMSIGDQAPPLRPAGDRGLSLSVSSGCD